MANEVLKDGEKPLESISGDPDTPPLDSSKTKDPNLSPDGQVSVEKMEVVAAPGATDYQHPLLKGKSPEEVDRIMGTMERATQEQNVELNRLHTEVQGHTSAPAPAVPEDEAEPYGDDFIGTRFKKFEERLSVKLQEMVAPLMTSQAEGKSTTVRERLTKKYRHFASLEPHIDKLLRDQKVDPNSASEGQLEMLYHTAVGLAAESGITLGGVEAPSGNIVDPKGGEKPIVNIPQHRPSGAPLPDPPKLEPRKLTENERIIAHAQFPQSKDPEKDYRDLQDLPEDELVEPGYSKEGWK